MSEEKKTLYHSELVKAGPVELTILSGVKESQYQNKPNYVVVKLAGRERLLNMETKEIEDLFAQYRVNDVVCVEASGSRESASVVECDPSKVEQREPDDRQTVARRDPPRREPEKPKGQPPAQQRPASSPSGRRSVADETPEQAYGRCRVCAAKAANLYVVAFDAAMFAKATVEKRHKVTLNAAHFQSCVSTLFIRLAKGGLSDHIPVKVPDAKAPAEKAQRPPAEAPAPPVEDDDVPF